MNNELDFLVVGAPKCGTTSLHRYLRQHPDTCMSEPKETYFFQHHHRKGLPYLNKNYFAHCSGEKRKGESTPTDFCIPCIPERIDQVLDHPRFVFILRDPVDRMYSHWWLHYAGTAVSHSFDHVVQQNLQQIENGLTILGDHGSKNYFERLDIQEGQLKNEHVSPYLEIGYYSIHIRRFLKQFSRSQIKILFLEDLKTDRQRTMEELFGFLEIEPDVSLSLNKKHNRARTITSYKILKLVQALQLNRIIPEQLRAPVKDLVFSMSGSKPTMKPSLRKKLTEHYRPYNKELEKITDRDLSHWMTV